MWLKYVYLAWLAFLIFLFGALLFKPEIGQLRRYCKLSQDHRTVVGEVTSVTPHMHNSCYLRFVVGSTEYKGGGGSCGDLPVGAPITIFYTPSDPKSYSTEEPWSAFVNDLVFCLLALAMLPLLAAAATYASVRRWMKRRPL